MREVEPSYGKWRRRCPFFGSRFRACDASERREGGLGEPRGNRGSRMHRGALDESGGDKETGAADEGKGRAATHHPAVVARTRPEGQKK